MAKNIPIPPSRRRAFSLIELLVVISIIAIVGVMAVPTLNRLTAVNQGEAGVTTVSTAVNAARILNHRLERSTLSDVGHPYEDASFHFRGTAVIVTPGGEIRLTENNQLARDQFGNALQYHEHPITNIDSLNGFEDVEGTDYLTLPRQTGIVGVVRRDNTFRFVPPPFAIRFNEHGLLTTEDAYVYYDFNDDRQYNVSTDDEDHAPPAGYDPTAHDPRRGVDLPRTSDGRYVYPHEEIPTVAAVVLFDLGQFDSSVGWADLHNPGPDTIDWLTRLGTPVYFSPLTGTALRGN